MKKNNLGDSIKKRTQKTPAGKINVVTTGGERFGDGDFLEIVRDDASGTVGLLHWEKGRSVIAPEHRLNGNRYVPTEAVTDLKHLPSQSASYLSSTQLFEDLRQFISKNTGLSSPDAMLLAFFCLGSFFSDVLSSCPCLLLSGDSLSAISLLRLLGCVCRHSLLLADAGLQSTTRDLKPTRLICQADARLDNMLAALQFPGFGISDRGFREISGAVAVYVGDVELRSQHLATGIWLPVATSLRYFSTQHELQESAEITQLQNQLLQYRLQNLRSVSLAEFDAPQLSGSSREIARTFGRCIVGAPEIQARIVEVLAPRDGADRIERSTRVDAIIVESLVALCHEQRSSVHVSQVAQIANAILSRDQESLQLRPREVGARMKKMGMLTIRLDSAGRGIYLLRDECARIHRLGIDFGVPTLAKELPGCPHCGKS